MRWRGETVCVLASGPSLLRSDVDAARAAAARVIAVNESWRMCPTADIVYGADCAWWTHCAPPASLAAERWTQPVAWEAKDLNASGLNVIPSKSGCDIAPPGADHIFQGHNSAFQAMALAVIWGASKVVFLGLDLGASEGRNHWHDDYPEPLSNNSHDQKYEIFRRAFRHAAPQLQALGVTVLNASRRTTLDCFPQCSISEAFP